MALDHAATQHDSEPELIPTLLPFQVRRRTLRSPHQSHVITRLMHEKSGRLYCGDDWDIVVPSLELYNAR